ncbi:hypothetical protein M3181_16020 [Mesobacillus maritimus]|uniref:hypothetical protein n=1 Tax=Mesobacillus maritimus TaxID=1643336 RepID=UPI00203C9D52|nr:hypothetical protein [Mesobacillus maritimus]MCM3670473.1 hypothetical protein [Mesobacillus maritimus]
MKRDFKEKREMKEPNKVKPFVELSEEISNNPNLENRQPTPQQKEFDEIEY